MKDCDPTTGDPDSEEGYSDDYQLEDIDISVSDYVQRLMKVRTRSEPFWVEFFYLNYPKMSSKF